MSVSKFVIAGGGIVAGYAAKRFVELGIKPGDLTILSSDAALPYERPPLSKGFLSGKDTAESILINPPDFYRDHGIDVRLDCAISSVDPARKRLHLRSGEDLDFETLILATGATARHLKTPGADLGNVLYLRSMADSKRIQDAAASAKQAVVIGGGFIGMEVAAVLRQKGLEVTMVLNEDRIWKRLFTPEMSDFFESYYANRGIRFFKNATVAAFMGKSGVTETALSDGLRIPCQMVVAGVGASPAIEFLQGSGLALGDGVIVNEYLEASRAGLLAAGDIANYPDLIYGKRRRVEHWDNAVSQGQHCANVAMGQRAPFRHVPYFFSDVFDLSYEFWGDTEGADQVVHRGQLASGSFSVWWMRAKTVVAAFAMKRPDDERDAAIKWTESKQRVDGSRLADADRPVAEATI